MIDKRVREDFIGLDKKIFFNNASWAPMLRPVKERIEAYWEHIYNLYRPTMSRWTTCNRFVSKRR